MSNNLDNIKEKLLKAKEELEKRAPKGVDPDKHESCVMDVKAKGHDVGSAHAICTSSLKKDELDDKIAAKMRAEMDKRGMGGKQIADHYRDTDESIPAKQRSNIKAAVGKQNAPKPKLSVVKGEECYKTSEHGQWSIEKSNYGPKGYGLYNQNDNAQRKAKNTGDVVADAGKNVNVKSYTTTGSSMGSAHAAAEAKRQAAANKKAPVKTLKDMSPEEKAALQAKYGAPLKKGADVAAEALATGNLPLFGAQPKSQPTDAQMFGHLVPSEAQVKQAENDWNNRFDNHFKNLHVKVDHLNKTNITESWGYGKSFNSMLSEEEITARNAYVSNENVED